MFGLLLLVVFLCVMGFVLSFIHNIFADDELEIKKAILLLLLTGVAGFVVKLVMSEADLTGAAAARFAVEFVTLTMLLKWMAYTPFRKALLIALVFSLVSLAFGLFLSYMLSPAQPA